MSAAESHRWEKEKLEKYFICWVGALVCLDPLADSTFYGNREFGRFPLQWMGAWQLWWFKLLAAMLGLPAAAALANM